jgi:metal-responsive CopG/Arc/MetJ family transcriptional regulator
MRKTKPSARMLSIKLDPELDHELSEIAHRKKVSRSWVVREALREYAARPRRSALDLAGNLAGSVEGPTDLSTNSRHLDGYGSSRR